MSSEIFEIDADYVSILFVPWPVVHHEYLPVGNPKGHGASLLPFISFTLQDMELFLQVEKRLLVRRGLFATEVCRALSLSPTASVLGHIDFLIEQIMRILEREDL